jgi:hypothetical protein
MSAHLVRAVTPIFSQSEEAVPLETRQNLSCRRL